MRIRSASKCRFGKSELVRMAIERGQERNRKLADSQAKMGKKPMEPEPDLTPAA